MARANVKGACSTTRVIQVDCRQFIRRALDASGLSYVGFMQTDMDNFLCIFSTADLHATERMSICFVRFYMVSTVK